MYQSNACLLVAKPGPILPRDFMSTALITNTWSNDASQVTFLYSILLIQFSYMYEKSILKSDFHIIGLNLQDCCTKYNVSDELLPLLCDGHCNEELWNVFPHAIPKGLADNIKTCCGKNWLHITSYCIFLR